MYPTLARVHALAIGIMVHVASRSSAGPVPSDELRARARLSVSYFDKIVADLRRHGLMRSTRRGGGGSVLGRSASLITMRDIVSAMSVPLAGSAQHRAGRAMARMSTDLWDVIEARQLDWLASVTLESLLQDRLRREAATARATPATEAELRRREVALLAATTPNSVFSIAATLSRRGTGRHDATPYDLFQEQP